MSISVTARKKIFWRRSGKHGIRPQTGPLLHGFARYTEAFRALPNDRECQNETFSHTISCTVFCVPKDKPIHWRYVLQRTAGFEPAITLKRGVEPHRTGRGLSPLSTRLPCASTPGIRFGRASRTAVVSFTRAVGVLQVYFTILWGGIHGKKAANCMKYPSIRLQ